jgi:hypothetical protein
MSELCAASRRPGLSRNSPPASCRNSRPVGCLSDLSHRLRGCSSPCSTAGRARLRNLPASPPAALERASGVENLLDLCQCNAPWLPAFDRSIVKIADIDWHHTGQDRRRLTAVVPGLTEALGQTPLDGKQFHVGPTWNKSKSI